MCIETKLQICFTVVTCLLFLMKEATHLPLIKPDRELMLPKLFK